MEYQHLIKASSMIRAVLENIIEEDVADNEMSGNIEKLKNHLEGFDEIIED